MLRVLLSPYFSLIIVPLVVGALTAFLKIVSRNDRYYSSIRKEDLAVGLDLALAAVVSLGISLMTVTQKAFRQASLNEQVPSFVFEKIFSGGILLLSLVFSLWLVSTLTRRFGWKSKEEMTWWWGIVMPWIYGLGILLFAGLWIGDAVDYAK